MSEIGNSGLIDYPFPIRDGVIAHLILPKDITLGEVNRLKAMLETLTTGEES